MIPQPTCRERLATIKEVFELNKRTSVIYACKRLDEDMLALAEDFPEHQNDITKEFNALVCGAYAGRKADAWQEMIAMSKRVFSDNYLCAALASMCFVYEKRYISDWQTACLLEGYYRDAIYKNIQFPQEAL